MYAVSEFIPSGCFITNNTVPFQSDIRDISNIYTSENDVCITIKDSHIRIVTRSKEQAKKVMKNIFNAIASSV